ncbi:MAG: hypothetical protein QXP01_00550 [Candidatus Hadarchaeum sp.]
MTDNLLGLEEALVKLLYLVLSHLNKRLERCRLRGFAEVVREKLPCGLDTLNEALWTELPVINKLL